MTTAASNFEKAQVERKAQDRRMVEIVATAIRTGTLGEGSPYRNLTEAAYRHLAAQETT